MEFLVLVVVILSILSLVLFFWCRNLVSKLKIVAEKRVDDINILNEYYSKLTYITDDEMWSGDPSFRAIKSHTDLLIKYFQDDEVYRAIGFLYEAKN